MSTDLPNDSHCGSISCNGQQHEMEKLSTHLKLMRQEYLKLQRRFTDLEQENALLKARDSTSKSSSLSPSDKSDFVSNLITFVRGLYQKELYSDLDVHIENKVIKAHKFVLSARSFDWDGVKLENSNVLVLQDVDFDVGTALLNWAYTDYFDNKKDDEFILKLLRTSSKYNLSALKSKCESALLSMISAENCIRFYEIATEIKADVLRNHCSALILNYWNDFTSEDFSHMPASLLYSMFKSKTEFPLHSAIRSHREDVVFLYLIEFDQSLSQEINRANDKGNIPLEIALKEKQFSIADTLIGNGADVNVTLNDGKTLFHCCIENVDKQSILYLLKNGADPNVSSTLDGSLPLHLLAASSVGNKSTAPLTAFSSQDLKEIVLLLLEKGANVTSVSSRKDKNTPLHLSILSGNFEVFSILLDTLVSDRDVLKENNHNLSPSPLEFSNSSGDTPLSLALSSKSLNERWNDKFATALIEKGALIDVIDEETGNSILMKACYCGNEEAAIFLINNGANLSLKNLQGETVLHVAAKNNLVKVFEILLSKNDEGIDLNAQTIRYNVAQSNLPSSESTQSFLRSHENTKSSSFSNPFESTTPSSFSDELVDDSNDEGDNDRLDVVAYNQTALHIAVAHDNKDIVKSFVKILNSRLTAAATNSRTKKETASAMSTQQQQPFFDFSLKDSNGKTVLSLALSMDNSKMSKLLLQVKKNRSIQMSEEENQRISMVPDIDEIVDENGRRYTLLQHAILEGNSNRAIFLLENGASFKKRCFDGGTCLELAITSKLNEVVEKLCDLGAVSSDFNNDDTEPNCTTLPLWLALESGQLHIAETLISHGCNVDAWMIADGGHYEQSLLHRSLDENNVAAAVFLIEHGCDVNCTRRRASNVNQSVDCDEAKDGLTPLHLACLWNLEDIVLSLICSERVDINAQDAEGKTALHLAIENEHDNIIEILVSNPDIDLSLSDNPSRTSSSGMTAFSCAMFHKNNKAAQKILSRHSSAVEQLDSRGRNYLHVAIIRKDFESVLFLLGIQADVNTPVKDQFAATPIHLAVESGDERIVRHLLLAGANVNDLTASGGTALHIAAEENLPSIASVLIENNINYSVQDSQLNNAFHVAILHGNLATVKVLLEKFSLHEVTAINNRGMNPLHVLGFCGKNNSSAIFDYLLQRFPMYPVNNPDSNGCTPLLLAYMNGNGNLCRSLIRAGAIIGIINKEGISVFNFPVATKQLLYKLLDILPREPPWIESETCLECSVKFGIKTRKHHCRHCGRILCSKCSDKEMPIVKFNLNKPVRVCDTCFKVMSLGCS